MARLPRHSPGPEPGPSLQPCGTLPSTCLLWARLESPQDPCCGPASVLGCHPLGEAAPSLGSAAILPTWSGPGLPESTAWGPEGCEPHPPTLRICPLPFARGCSPSVQGGSGPTPPLPCSGLCCRASLGHSESHQHLSWAGLVLSRHQHLLSMLEGCCCPRGGGQGWAAMTGVGSGQEVKGAMCAQDCWAALQVGLCWASG